MSLNKFIISALCAITVSFSVAAGKAETVFEQNIKSDILQTEQKLLNQNANIPQVIKSETIENACQIDAPCLNPEQKTIDEKSPINVNKDAENTSLSIKEQKAKKKAEKKLLKEKAKLEKQKSKQQKKQKALFKSTLEKVDIESYLMLSHAQILQAKENRVKGEENIKPILDEIKLIETKIERIERRNTPSLARKNQIKRYELEIRNLKSKANEVRKENVENFEKILTPEQLELFDDIKRINIDDIIKENNL